MILSSCNYTGNEKDNWGDTFNPPENNYMSYTYNSCRNELTANQISSMYQHIVYYMAHGGFPLPGINGEPIYNKNIIALEGISNSNDVEDYISPEFIQVDNYTANSGSEVILTAQSQIKINAGVHLKPGSNFKIRVATITDCSSVTTANKNTELSKFISNSQDNDVENRIIELYLNSKTDKKSVIPNMDDNLINTAITIHPNPTSGKFIISTNEIITSYKLYNSYGALLANKKTNSNKVSVVIQNFPAGIYMIRVVLASEKIVMKKIIKE